MYDMLDVQIVFWGSMLLCVYIYEALKNMKRSEADNYRKQAYEHLDQGKFEKAEEYFNKSLELLTKHGKSIDISKIYCDLSILRKEEGRYEESFIFLMKSKKRFPSSNSDLGKYKIDAHLLEMKNIVGEEQFNQWMKEYVGKKNEPEVPGRGDTKLLG